MAVLVAALSGEGAVNAVVSIAVTFVKPAAVA